MKYSSFITSPTFCLKHLPDTGLELSEIESIVQLFNNDTDLKLLVKKLFANKNVERNFKNILIELINLADISNLDRLHAALLQFYNQIYSTRISNQLVERSRNFDCWHLLQQNFSHQKGFFKRNVNMKDVELNFEPSKQKLSENHIDSTSNLNPTQDLLSCLINNSLYTTNTTMAKSIERSVGANFWNEQDIWLNNQNYLQNMATGQMFQLDLTTLQQNTDKINQTRNDYEKCSGMIEQEKFNEIDDEDNSSIPIGDDDYQDLPFDFHQLLSSPTDEQIMTDSQEDEYSINFTNSSTSSNYTSSEDVNRYKTNLVVGSNLTSSIWSTVTHEDDNCSENSNTDDVDEPDGCYFYNNKSLQSKTNEKNNNYSYFYDNETNLNNNYYQLTDENLEAFKKLSLQNDQTFYTFDRWDKPNYNNQDAYKQVKWSENVDYDNNVIVDENYIIEYHKYKLSLLKLNHDEQLSSFTEVLPKPSKNLEPEPLVYEDDVVSTNDNNDTENEEDLLTSVKTHFCPIRSESMIVQKQSTNLLPDGTSFDIDASPDLVLYQRTSSGLLVCESDLNETEPKKYMVYNPKEETLNDGKKTNFVLKFSIRNQNTKCCQTDFSNMIEKKKKVQNNYFVITEDARNLSKLDFDNFEISKKLFDTSDYDSESLDFENVKYISYKENKRKKDLTKSSFILFDSDELIDFDEHFERIESSLNDIISDNPSPQETSSEDVDKLKNLNELFHQQSFLFEETLLVENLKIVNNQTPLPFLFNQNQILIEPNPATVTLEALLVSGAQSTCSSCLGVCDCNSNVNNLCNELFTTNNQGEKIVDLLYLQQLYYMNKNNSLILNNKNLNEQHQPRKRGLSLTTASIECYAWDLNQASTNDLIPTITTNETLYNNPEHHAKTIRSFTF